MDTSKLIDMAWPLEPLLQDSPPVWFSILHNLLESMVAIPHIRLLA
jgi:hypothetical protein